ncbi:MAG: nucleoside monophosphate kinase [Patescibacteria group bacterium]|nr:nucleoside monophosphate kinase [Patescibacteria group bacterium]
MILMMGMAGSGKGTQGRMLADAHGLHLISMGDVFRTYATGVVREKMLAGALINDDETIALMNKVLLSIDDKGEILLDGFPRSIAQAEWLLEQAKAGRCTLRAAFHLVASREALKKRLQARGRIDDTDAVIEARFDEYERATAPILDWLTEHDVNVINVDAERSVEVINADLEKHLSK